jgi:hypothetical protein
MSSRQKRKQARLNGAKAAGTKSAAGIERSSKNAIKHGLNSKMIVLSNESKTRFDELHETYIQTFQPANAVERDLVDQIAAAQWRLRRIWSMQTAAFDLKMDQQRDEIKRRFDGIDEPTRLTYAFITAANEEKSLDLLLRYETAYTRMYQRALNTLMRLRRENGIEESITSDAAEPEEPEFRNDPDQASPAAEPPSPGTHSNGLANGNEPQGVPESQSNPVPIDQVPESEPRE